MNTKFFININISIKKISISLLIFSILFIKFTNQAYRQNAIQIFDKYTLIDKFKTYLHQSILNQCSLNDGPNCYQLAKFSEFSEVKKNYFKNFLIFF